MNVTEQSLFEIAQKSFLSPATDAICPITDPVGQGETVLGTVPPELRGLYIAADLLSKRLDEILEKDPLPDLEKLSLDNVGATMEAMGAAFGAMGAIISQLQPVKRKLGEVSGLFWSLLQSALPIPAGSQHDTRGIRENWTVVSFVSPEQNIGAMFAEVLEGIPGVRAVCIRPSHKKRN